MSYDITGIFYPPLTPEQEAMMTPAVCQCGQVYDLGMVTVTARYADASVWTAPCCGVQADDRRWVHQPYRELRPQ